VAASSASVPQVDRSERLRSRKVSDFPIPVGREESWRFTPLARLRELHTLEPGSVSASGAVTLQTTAPADAKVEQVNEVVALRDIEVDRVKSLPGVEWAVPLYWGIRRSS